MDSRKNQIDLSVIIVSWNVKEILRRNLESLFARTGRDMAFEVFVVDNASSDRTAEMVAEYFQDVKLIANSENLGFAKANNQALKLAQGRHILLLNPDMEVKKGSLAQLVAWLDQHPEAGVASCRLKDAAGNNIPHVRRFPRLFDQLMIALKLPHLFPSILDGYLQKDFDYSKEAAVDSVRGSFFAVNGKAFKDIGFLDERFFIWFEEVDYCRQAKAKNWRVMYTPEMECTDLVGQSFSQVKIGRTQSYFRASMLAYFRKWHSLGEYLVLWLAWLPGLAFARVFDVLRLKKGFGCVRT